MKLVQIDVVDENVSAYLDHDSGLIYEIDRNEHVYRKGSISVLTGFLEFEEWKDLDDSILSALPFTRTLDS